MKLIILKMSRRDRREAVAIYTALNPISASEFLHFAHFPPWFRGGGAVESLCSCHHRNKLIHSHTHTHKQRDRDRDRAAYTTLFIIINATESNYSSQQPH